MRDQVWLMAFCGLALIGFILMLWFVAASLFPSKVYAADCGPGLAREDMSGTCRRNPPTAGALEVSDTVIVPGAITPPAPAPVPTLPGVVVLKAIYTAEVTNAETRSTTDPWDHCAGVNGGNVCRVLIVFDPSSLNGKTIDSVKLAPNVTYVSPGMEAATFALVRYDGDPQADNNCLAWNRADGWRYIKATTMLRTTGTKTFTLTATTALADLKSAAASGRPFAIAIRANDERTPDRFIGVGKAPELRVTFK